MSAIPQEYKDDITNAVAWARAWLFKDDQTGGNLIPGKWEAYDDIPPEIVEAVLNVETGGTWNPNTRTATGNPDAPYAYGLGQIVYGGSQELSWYEGLANTRLSIDDLYDPLVSIRLTAFGLGGRFTQVREITGKGNWFWAGAAYFGCVPDKDGNFSCGPDSQGTTAQDYVNGLMTYVTQNYGSERAGQLWDAEKGDLTHKANQQTEAIKDKVTGVVTDIPGAIVAAAQYAAVALAIVAGGVALAWVAAHAVGLGEQANGAFSAPFKLGAKAAMA